MNSLHRRSGAPVRVLALGAAMLAPMACARDAERTREDAAPPSVAPQAAPWDPAPQAAPGSSTESSAPAVVSGTRRVTVEGLATQDLALGAGEGCPPGAIAEVRYVAMLQDGTVFDSTEARKRTLTFDLGSPGLIAGLRQGIQGMAAGGRRRIEIPARLAYGDLGRDPIPPKADLVFEIELIRWEQPPSGY